MALNIIQKIYKIKSVMNENNKLTDILSNFKDFTTINNNINDNKYFIIIIKDLFYVHNKEYVNSLTKCNIFSDIKNNTLNNDNDKILSNIINNECTPLNIKINPILYLDSKYVTNIINISLFNKSIKYIKINTLIKILTYIYDNNKVTDNSNILKNILYIIDCLLLYKEFFNESNLNKISNIIILKESIYYSYNKIPIIIINDINTSIVHILNNYNKIEITKNKNNLLIKLFNKNNIFNEFKILNIINIILVIEQINLQLNLQLNNKDYNISIETPIINISNFLKKHNINYNINSLKYLVYNLYFKIDNNIIINNINNYNINNSIKAYLYYINNMKYIDNILLYINKYIDNYNIQIININILINIILYQQILELKITFNNLIKFILHYYSAENTLEQYNKDIRNDDRSGLIVINEIESTILEYESYIISKNIQNINLYKYILAQTLGNSLIDPLFELYPSKNTLNGDIYGIQHRDINRIILIFEKYKKNYFNISKYSIIITNDIIYRYYYFVYSMINDNISDSVDDSHYDIIYIVQVSIIFHISNEPNDVIINYKFYKV